MPNSFVAVCHCVNAVLGDAALCIKGRQRDFVHTQAVYLVALAAEHVHSMPELLFLKKRFFVVLVPDLFFNHGLFNGLCFPNIFFRVFHRVHFGPQHDYFLDRPPLALVFHLSKHFFICSAVERVLFGIVACVVKVVVFCHVFINIFCLDV